MARSLFVSAIVVLFSVTSASAAGIRGVVTDPTGGVLPGTPLTIRAVATGRVWTVQTGPDGRYQIGDLPTGDYFVVVRSGGFREVVRSVVLERSDQTVELSIQVAVVGLDVELNVTAARAERDVRQLPLHIETLDRGVIADTNPLSTGDLFTTLPNINPVGGGPFGVRPRLRGLDSTRLLVLVDGERLNTARHATERTGAEVGLISPDALSRIEIVNGAGTLMYGSDALAGTINIITNEPQFSQARRFLYGLNSFFSSNENGARGTLMFGVTAPRYALRVQGGAERFENYRAGSFDVEDTRTFFDSGVIRRADTIDDSFGFAFKAFPDPFNTPYVRTDDEVVNSGAKGGFVNATALVKLRERQTLRLRYQNRRMKDIGFPDFAPPYFFNVTSLPYSRFERLAAAYEIHDISPWLRNLSVSAYYQGTERLLQNQLPVQFPVPAATFLPISVMRLDVLSETEQRVWTPGISVQARLIPAANHLMTAGFAMYRDRSSDRRTTTTTTSMIGQVVPGPRGPSPLVFDSPVVLGPPTVDHPVRVPSSAFRDIGLFLQDEWRFARRLSLVAGVRGDFYNVRTDPTPGYDVAAVVAGANPAIDPRTLPDPNGASYGRKALTGDIGFIANTDGRLTPFVRVGRSYRHPNLEEMLFAGPATVGSIAPNVTVQSETGTNIDFGANIRTQRFSGGAYVFVNKYKNFIAQEIVVATTPSRTPLVQTINFADVRIHGLELSGQAPFRFRQGVVTVTASGAFTRGDVEDAAASTLAGVEGPADNITPMKLVAAVRFTEPRGRWWAEYGVRRQGQVTRVSPTLLESPFLIPQDLLSLDDFTVHRLGAGIDLFRGPNTVRLTLGLENLTNEFYREHFQFAPARGRSFTAGLTIGAF